MLPDSVEIRNDESPPPMVVKEQGLAFSRGPDGIEIEIEFPDYGGWSGVRVGTRYVTIPLDAWDAIVQHVKEADNGAS